MDGSQRYPVNREPPATAKAVGDEILQRLVAFNEAKVGPREMEEFTLSVRDDNGQLIGGLTGELFWNCVHVGVLWVSEGAWGNGYGMGLMREAEAIARARSCDFIYLSTMTFQAPEFYQKCGFEEFGRIADAPRGFDRLWFVKRLR